MADTLPEQERARLVKLIGLLGSMHAGERDAAVVKVNEILAKYRMTWAELVARPAPEENLPAVTVTVGDTEPDLPPDAEGWRAACAHILANAPGVMRITPTYDEPRFVRSLFARPPGYVLTPKQESWLRDIAARAGIGW